MGAKPRHDYKAMVDLPHKPYIVPANRGENAPVCNRKFCSVCGRWRPLVDFDVHTRTMTGTPVFWQARCRVCHRMVARYLTGHKPRGQRMTEEQSKARGAELLKLRRLDEEWLEKRREYERIYLERRRRENGVKPRKIGHRSKKYSNGNNPKDTVPNAIFRELLEKQELSPSELARRLGWKLKDGRADERRVRRLLGLGGGDDGARQDRMTYKNAVRLAQALQVDPWMVGI